MQTIPEAVAAAARAEIIWGTPADEVLALLRSKGLGEDAARVVVEKALAERAAILRTKLRRNLVWGGLLVALFVGYYFFSSSFGIHGVSTVVVFAVAVFLGFGLLRVRERGFRPPYRRWDFGD